MAPITPLAPTSQNGTWSHTRQEDPRSKSKAQKKARMSPGFDT